jgi:hypothetical protein
LETRGKAGLQKGSHLGDGDFVEHAQALGGGQALADQHRIEAFEVGEHDELLQRSVVAEVAFRFGVGVAPLLRRLAEQGDVERIGLLGVDEGGLGVGDRRRDKGVPDGVGVDAVVDLGEGALEIPIELEAVVLVVLEALELFDEVKLELNRHPGGEFEGDVLVGVGAAVATGGGNQTDRPGGVDPAFGGEDEAVKPGLFSNPIEFDGIKIGVVELLPDAKELDGVPVPEPVGDKVVCSLRILVAGDVGETDIILPVSREHGNVSAFHREARALGFTHMPETMEAVTSKREDPRYLTLASSERRSAAACGVR